MKLVILLAIACSAALAQTPALVPVLITKYQVKPGSTVEFEQILKKYSEAVQKDGRQFYMVWRGSLGDQYEYTVMSAIPGIETLDEKRPAAKAYGEATAMQLSFRLAPCVNSVKQQMWHLHPEASILSAQDFKIARVTEVALAGSAATGEQGRIQARLMPKLKEAGRKNHWLLHLDQGGDDYLSLVITPFDSYADMKNEISLTKLVGADEAKKIAAARVQHTRLRNTFIWAYRPDLSFRNLDK